MNENPLQTAERVVKRLLDDSTAIEEYASHEEFEKRPGGPKDPMRQTTMAVNLKNLGIGRQGKRSVTPKGKVVASGPKEDEEEDKDGEEEQSSTSGAAIAPKPSLPKSSRFTWKPESKQECAWKKGKKASGQTVAKKPGKVSYKEALMRQVLENIRIKKAKKASGTLVAKKPGKIAYRNETLALLRERKMAGGMKGIGKKKVAPVATAPGKVSRGKR